MGPFCNFRGPFFKGGGGGGQEKVHPKGIGTDCPVRKQTFIDALLPFWNILGN